MKQFDTTKPYQTRSGLKVGELLTYLPCPGGPVLYYGVVVNPGGTQMIRRWETHGIIQAEHYDNDRYTQYDLVNIPEKIAGIHDECKDKVIADDDLIQLREAYQMLEDFANDPNLYGLTRYTAITAQTGVVLREVRSLLKTEAK